MLSIPDMQFHPEFVVIADKNGKCYFPSFYVDPWNSITKVHSAYVGGTDSYSPVRLMADIVNGRVVRIHVMGPFKVPLVATVWDPTA